MPPLTIGALALKVLPWAAVFTVGFAAAEVYEHRAPWGLQAKRAAALEDVGEWRDAALSWKRNRDGWFEYARGLERERETVNDDLAAEVARCSASAQASVSKAFDNGYAAGRAAGRRSCGVSDANGGGAGGGQPAGDGMQPSGQTLSGGWAERAYRPSGAVSPDD